MWKQSPHAVQLPDVTVKPVAVSHPMDGAGVGGVVGAAVVGEKVGGGSSIMQTAKPLWEMAQSEENVMSAL